jgi:hypothetical protein
MLKNVLYQAHKNGIKNGIFLFIICEMSVFHCNVEVIVEWVKKDSNAWNVEKKVYRWREWKKCDVL